MHNINAAHGKMAPCDSNNSAGNTATGRLSAASKRQARSSGFASADAVRSNPSKLITLLAVRASHAAATTAKERLSLEGLTARTGSLVSVSIAHGARCAVAV
jgi:hypothetical protein